MTDLERAKEQFSTDLFATQVTGVEILEASAGHANVCCGCNRAT